MRRSRVKKNNKKKIKAMQVSASILFALFFANLVYLLLHGDQGYFALKGVEDRLQIAEFNHHNVSSKRQALELRVKMLRPDSLDRDMLDERARVVLGMVAPDELVILGE